MYISFIFAKLRCSLIFSLSKYRRHGHTQNDRRVEDGGEAEGEEDSGEVLMEDDLIETQR